MNGEWLLRIDDIDPPREIAGAATQQIEQLARFGLHSDSPILYQSTRRQIHEQLIDKLVRAKRAYPCGCSAKDLPSSGVYLGTCRDGLDKGRTPRSVRLLVPTKPVQFLDNLQGEQVQHPATQCGDFVIRRGDGLIAYQLAVVADDHHQDITEVVRGADLIDSVGRQVLLYEALDYPTPDYLHLPVVVDINGRKLSKSDHDDPIERFSTQQALRLALRALGHEPPIGAQSLEAQWNWASAHWDLSRVPLGPVTI